LKTALLSIPMLAGAGGLHLVLLTWPIILVRDSPGVSANPRLWVFLLLASVWFFTESLNSLNETRRPTGVNCKSWLELEIGVAILLTFWTCMLAAPAVDQGSIGLATVCGPMLMATGILFRYLSFKSLGRYFLNDVAVVPGQPLMTKGIYGVVRHPSEAGTICLVLGAVTLFESALGFAVCLVLLLPAVIRRIGLEDDVLRREHAAAFVRYAREVGALVPRIGSVSR
jgi:protein-S-isoprenylcysteine O-methyltransferase Ste14